MAPDDMRIRKTVGTLAGHGTTRATPGRPADYPGRRRLAAMRVRSQARWDRLPGEW